MTSHYVDFDATGGRSTRAICGAIVGRYHHDAAPTCDACQQILAARPAEDVTAEEMFGSVAPGTPVHSTLSDPLAGYRPKGARS